ncbi:MAG: DUF4345 family protein, partial [Polyangiales bacterium]
LGFAVFGIFAPVRFASMLDISLASTTAIADFAGTYGGMSAGVAAILALGIARPAFAKAATMLAVATSFGLFLGHSLSVLRHGPAGVYVHGSIALEVGAGLLGLWLLSREGTSRVPAMS